MNHPVWGSMIASLAGKTGKVSASRAKGIAPAYVGSTYIKESRVSGGSPFVAVVLSADLGNGHTVELDRRSRLSRPRKAVGGSNPPNHHVPSFVQKPLMSPSITNVAFYYPGILQSVSASIRSRLGGSYLRSAIPEGRWHAWIAEPGGAVPKSIRQL